MHRLRSIVTAHPIGAYLAIAFSTSWVLTVASSISIVFALLALFGPALAAIIVTRLDGTWPELRARITGWRRPVRWYVLALGIPFAVAGTARLVLTLAGQAPDGLGTISAIEVVIFVLVIGEEIGWRGFLQPRLRERHGLAIAGVLTGIVWTLWHLPVYLTPELGPAAFLTFALWVIPLAVAMGAVAEGARWSVIVATVMHGAANIATPILLPGVDRTVWLLLTGALYAVVALLLVIAARRGSAITSPSSASAATATTPTTPTTPMKGTNAMTSTTRTRTIPTTAVTGFVLLATALIAVGSWLIPGVGEYALLAIGVICLAAFAATRSYGYAVAGGIIVGLGVGVLLTTITSDPSDGIAFLLAFAAGFAAIWPMGFAAEPRVTNAWPLIPAAVLAASAITVATGSVVVFQALGVIGIAALVGGGLKLLRDARKAA